MSNMSILLHAAVSKNPNSMKSMNKCLPIKPEEILSSGSFCDGWLTKCASVKRDSNIKKVQRQKGRGWNKRWFFLREDVLLYSKLQESGILRGEIRMADVVKVAGAEEKELIEMFPHCFKIYTPQRIFYVYADTSQEMHHWLRSINCLSKFDQSYNKRPKPEPNSRLQMANFRSELLNLSKIILGNVQTILGNYKTIDPPEDQKKDYAKMQAQLRDGTLFFLEDCLKTTAQPFNVVPKKKLISGAKALSASLVKLDNMLPNSPDKAALDIVLNVIRPRLLEVSKFVVSAKLVPYDELSKIGLEIISVAENLSDANSTEKHRKIEILAYEFVTHVNCLNQPKLTVIVRSIPSLVAEIVEMKTSQAAEDDPDLAYFIELLIKCITDTLHLALGKELKTVSSMITIPPLKK